MVRLRDSGKQIAKSFHNLKDAKRWETEAKQAQQTGQIKDFESGAMRFGALAIYWFKNHAMVYKSPSAVRRDEQLLRNQILPAFGGHRIDNIHATEVTGWTKALIAEKCLSPKTANLCLALLRKILRDAVSWKILRYHEIDCVHPWPRPPFGHPGLCPFATGLSTRGDCITKFFGVD